jgi:putative long chain acyl-CoA synthase
MQVGDRTLAVGVVSVRDGYQLTPQDVTEGLRGLEPGQRPDLVYVVPEIPRSSTYRPSVRAVQAEIAPEPADNVWRYNRVSGAYEPLTAESALILFS